MKPVNIDRPVRPNRRTVAKAVVGGIAVAAWQKPVVEAVVLPAHATISGVTPVTTVVTAAAASGTASLV